MNNDFEEMRRLSIYIQESYPEKMSELAIKIVDGLMERLDANRTRRLIEVRNIYIFFVMYSLITRDLYYFCRIFTKMENLLAIFNDAAECATRKDKSIKEIMFKQLNAFYKEQSSIFSVSNLTVAKNMETQQRFNYAFEKSCIEIFHEYIKE